MHPPPEQLTPVAITRQHLVFFALVPVQLLLLQVISSAKGRDLGCGISVRRGGIPLECM